MKLLEIEAFTQWDGLPSLPEQLTKVMDEVGKASSMDYNIVEMVQYDVSIACRVLKMANSPLYGYAGKIASLQQACGLLGLEMIKNIVFTTPAIELFQDVKEVYQSQIDCSRLWVHMATTGVIADWICRFRDDLDADICFTAGLTHGIGKIALVVSHPELYVECLELSEKENISLEEAETEIIGFSHAELSLKMATAWDYPAPLTENLKSQIARGDLAPGNKISHTVRLAKYIADHLGFGEGMGPHEPEPPLKVWSGAGITQDEFQESLPGLRELADKVALKWTA